MCLIFTISILKPCQKQATSSLKLFLYSAESFQFSAPCPQKMLLVKLLQQYFLSHSLNRIKSSYLGENILNTSLSHQSQTFSFSVDKKHKSNQNRVAKSLMGKGQSSIHFFLKSLNRCSDFCS